MSDLLLEAPPQTRPNAVQCRPGDTFGFRLWHVLHAWKRRLEAALAPFDLTHMQFVVMASTSWLARQGEVPTQTRIANFSQLDRMMASKILRLLEDKGYIQRTTHPDDPRAKRVDLSPAGCAALDRAVPVLLATQEAFFGRLTSEGRACLASQLDALLLFEGYRGSEAPPRPPATEEV